MKVGENVRRLRKEHRLSQRQLAEMAQISPTYLCDIEKGRCSGSIRVFQTFAKVLNVEISNFFQ